MLLQVPNKAKVNKDDLAKLLKVDPKDIYIEDKDFAAYSSLFYVDELPERADPVSYNLKSEIETLADMGDADCIDTVAEAIDKIPDSIKIDIISKAILVVTHESNTLFENDIIDNIDNYLTEFLLNNLNYIFPEED